MDTSELGTYRELVLALRQLQRHWGALAEHLNESSCMEVMHLGTHRASALLQELEELAVRHDIPVGPTTLATGRFVANLRNLMQDPFLERSRAVRFAALDLEHIRLLLEYLAAIARNRGDDDRSEWLQRWLESMQELREHLVTGIVELAADPQRAGLPIDPGPFGRAGLRFSNLLAEYSGRADRRWRQRAPK